LARLTALRPAAPAATWAGAPTPAALLAALRRRWRLAVILGVPAGLVVAAAVWAVTPTTYTARTLLHVASIHPVIIQETPEVKTDFSSYQRTQVALVKSRPVITAALRSPKVQGLVMVQNKADPVTWLEKQLKADYTVAPEILRITLAGEQPDELLLLVAAVREAYLSEMVNKEQNRRLARLEQLKKLYGEFDGSLREKQRALRNLADDLGSRDSRLLALRQELALKELAAVQAEYLQTQSQLRKDRLELQALPDRDKLVAALTYLEALVEEQLRKDSVYDQAAREIERFRRDLALLEVGPDHPTKQRLEKELHIAEKALATRREELRPALLEKLQAQALSESDARAAAIQKRVPLTEKLLETLGNEIKDRTEKNHLATKKTADLEWLKDEISQEEDIVRKVGAQVHNLQVELQAPPRVTALEDPIIVDDGGKRMRTAGIGFVGGMLGLMLLVAFLEFRARKVASTEDVANGLQLKVMGTIPLLPRRARGAPLDRVLDRQAPWYDLLVEAVDATRLVLLHTARLDSLRVLLVTSAGGGEGKSMLSVHLASSLVRAGHKTLLVDGDLRRPTLHTLFGLSACPGLAEVLRGDLPVENALLGSADGVPALLTAGNAAGEAAQLLGNGRLGELFEKLKERFEFIIVDSAPVLPVVDSQLVALHADGVLLSVLRDVSRLPAVHAACERLALLKISIVGAVVHGTATHAGARAYYYAQRQLGAG
jgi:capsular exopolysaccharide synthesis family protein